MSLLMLLYGLYSRLKLNYIKNRQNYKNKKYYKNNVDYIKNKMPITKLTVGISIPFLWNIYVLYNKYLKLYIIYLYSHTYYFKFVLLNKKSYLLVDQAGRGIYYSTIYYNTYSKQYFKNLIKLLYQVQIPKFLKITFRGKGYYLYKNKRNTITPQFNYAHRIYIYSYFIPVKFLNKTTVLLFGYATEDLFKAGYNIKAMRPINIFTGRGVRFAKQIIYKKTGKVSAYR
uniref:Ribosomal protein L6 n=1 Tax=Strombidium sp. TaxID=181122 RepID=A0A7T0Q600_9SPIT|nr:ribosomal protein L6 [Strombidium sp.]